MAGLPPAIVDANVTAMPSWVTASTTYYGYCKIADVQLLFVNQANMVQTAADKNKIAQAITYAAIDLQGFLELAYVMPYVGTNPVILATLSEINAKWAGAKLYELMEAAAEPLRPPIADMWLGFAHAQIRSILDGEKQWAAPFGDAVAQVQHPVYPQSALVQSQPSARNGDNTAFPLFKRTRSTFQDKRDDLM